MPWKSLGAPSVEQQRPISQPQAQQLDQGNINLYDRPRVVNPDNSISTVLTKSFNIDGKEVLLPTISDTGKKMTDKEAFDQYLNTGKNFGIFNSPEEATEYAIKLHKQQESLLNNQGGWRSLGIPSEEMSTEPQTQQNFAQKVGRNLVRAPEKIGEALLETGEGVGALAKSYSPLDRIMKFIGSGQLTPEQLVELKERVSKYNIDVPGVSPPVISSEGLGKSANELTGNFFEPRDEWERGWDNTVKMATNALLGGKLTMGKVGRSLAGGAAGEVLSKGIEEKSGGPGPLSEAVKIGSMILAHSINPGAAKQLAEDSFAKARVALPKGAIGDASELETDLKGMVDKWKRGGVTWDKKKGIAEAEQALSKIRDGKLEFDEGWELKRDMNKNAESLYKEEGATSRTIRDAREKIGEARSALKRFLAKSERVYPEFYHEMSKGDEIYGAIQNSKMISNWIKKKLPMLGDEPLLKILFGVSEAAATRASPLMAMGGGALIGANQVRALASQMKNSPALRKYYIDTIKNAVQQNKVGFLNSYRRLKKEYEKKDSIPFEEYQSE